MIVCPTAGLYSHSQHGPIRSFSNRSAPFLGVTLETAAALETAALIQLLEAGDQASLKHPIEVVVSVWSVALLRCYKQAAKRDSAAAEAVVDVRNYTNLDSSAKQAS